MEKEKLSLNISKELFWTIASALAVGAFLLGSYVGQARFDREKSDFYECNKLLMQDNKRLKAANDSLVKFSQPAKTIAVSIKSPSDNSRADDPNDVPVSGTIKNIPHGHHLWLVVHPEKSSGWWPQVSEIMARPGGDWNGSVRLGGVDNRGERFQVHVVVADQASNSQFSGTAMFNNSLPNGAASLDYITVIKNR